MPCWSSSAPTIILHPHRDALDGTYNTSQSADTSILQSVAHTRQVKTEAKYTHIQNEKWYWFFIKNSQIILKMGDGNKLTGSSGVTIMQSIKGLTLTASEKCWQSLQCGISALLVLPIYTKVSCFYGLFNWFSFHKFYRQLSAFSLCSSDFFSALLVLPISLYESLLQPWFNPLFLTGLKAPTN